MDYTYLENKLTELVASAQLRDAIAFVSSLDDYEDAENAVSVALGIERCPQNVIDAALECFVSTRENRTGRGGHGSWVHSLSHFTSNLWGKGFNAWIKRLNEIAFTGANELGETGCCDRLVRNFSVHAKWDSIPAEYGYTQENLAWANVDVGNDLKYPLALIKASPFASEIASIRFDLGWPQLFLKTVEWIEQYGQPYTVSLQKIRDSVERLSTLGDNITDLANIEEEMIRRFIADIETEISASEPGFNREKRLPRSLELSRLQLQQLGK